MRVPVRCSNALLLGLLLGCATPKPAPRIAPQQVAPVNGLVIRPSNPGGVVGDTVRMVALLTTDGQAPRCDLTWESLNPDVATIDPKGRLIAHKAGSTTVRARCGETVVGTTAYFGAKP